MSARRGVRSSTYLAALVRAHVATSPPLTIDELAVLKQGVAVLAKLGRTIADTGRCIAQGGPVSPSLQKELALTRTVIAALEQRSVMECGLIWVPISVRIDMGTHIV